MDIYGFLFFKIINKMGKKIKLSKFAVIIDYIDYILVNKNLLLSIFIPMKLRYGQLTCLTSKTDQHVREDTSLLW